MTVLDDHRVGSSASPCSINVHLASHWPCVTDFSGLSTYGLTVSEREMSTPPTFLMGYDTLYLCTMYDDMTI